MKVGIFFSYLGAASELVTVSWIWPEDMRLLGQKPRTVYYPQHNKEPVLLVGLHSSSKSPNPMWMTQVGFYRCQSCCMLYYSGEQYRFRDSVTFIVIRSELDICPGGDITSLLKVVFYKYNSEKWPR